MRLTVRAAFGLLSVLMSLSILQDPARGETSKDTAPPFVFQAAGPSVGSIEGTVDEFRAALGNPNNGNAAGPLAGGRREINWDGGGNNQTTAVAGNPFPGFQIIRGALFTTPNGTGFVQAPPAADPALFPPGGLAGLFHNPTYGEIFRAFSPLRLFSAIGSNVTEVDFFVPGGGNIPATTTGFGAVFVDVDQPDGSEPGNKHGNRRDDDRSARSGLGKKHGNRGDVDRLDRSGPDKEHGNRGASTFIEYFGTDGELLFSSAVPASPGDGSFSFFGIVFDDARIARVRITSGDVAPGPDDDREHDIVVMDDFIDGEPQASP